MQLHLKKYDTNYNILTLSQGTESLIRNNKLESDKKYTVETMYNKLKEINPRITVSDTARFAIAICERLILNQKTHDYYFIFY